MSQHPYLIFKRRFDDIDEQKLALAKNEEDTTDEFFEWAINHYSKSKREELIQLCIQQEQPEWQIVEMRRSHEQWEVARSNIKREDVEIFAKMDIQYNEQPVKRSFTRKVREFVEWKGLES